MSYRPLHIIKFEDDTAHGSSVVVSPGTTLLDAAKRAGLEIPSICSGQRDCGLCLVIIQDGQVSHVDPDESEFLSSEQLANGYRLACCARVGGSITARLIGEIS